MVEPESTDDWYAKGPGKVHVATWRPKEGPPVEVWLSVDVPAQEDKEVVFEGEGRMEYIPIKRKNQRCCYYVTGSSGSGKSTWIANTLKKLMRQHPKKERWLFSSITDYDPVFMQGTKKLLKKVDYDKVDLASLRTDHMVQKDENGKSKGCIAVFDDYDGTEQGKLVQPLLVQCLKEGRKLGIDCFMVSHNARDFHRTRDIITQATTFVTFPAVNRVAMENLAAAYWDMNRGQIKMYIESLRPKTAFYFLAHNRWPKSIVTSDRVIHLH